MTTGRRGAVGLAGPVVEHDGVGDEDHRQDEVALHQHRVEVEQHDEAAEHDLGEHAADEPERQPGQVAPAWLAARASRAPRRSRRPTRAR